MSKLIELPYPELTEVAGRTLLRNTCSYSSKEVYKMPLDMIQVRGVFNFRQKPDWMPDEQWLTFCEIDELALSMLESGMEEPLEGDLTPDGKIFYITEGWRRWMAHKSIQESGYDQFLNAEGVYVVDVVRNPTGMTELGRMKRIISSQNKMKLEPMMFAKGLQRIKDTQVHPETGKRITNDDIASWYGYSRQWADNILALNDLPAEIIEKVERGEIKPTAALHYIKDQRKATKEAATKKQRNLGGIDDSEDLTSEEAEDDYLQDRLESVKELIFAPEKYDSESVHAQEEEANQATDPNWKETRPKVDREDALGEIDFKKEKTEAEMDLNEAIKMVDKLHVNMDRLPKAQKQFVEDNQRLCVFVVNKMKNAIEIIKKAADKR